MTYAIIETGGKQLRVEPGRFYDVERLPVEENESVTIDRVLFVENEGEFSIGQPFVTGATIEGVVLRHLRGRKIIVYKMRPKKKTRKKQGHRQELTRLMINTINLNGSSIGSSQSPTSAAGQVTTVSPEPEESEAIVDTASSPITEVTGSPEPVASPPPVQPEAEETDVDEVEAVTLPEPEDATTEDED